MIYIIISHFYCIFLSNKHSLAEQNLLKNVILQVSTSVTRPSQCYYKFIISKLKIYFQCTTIEDSKSGTFSRPFHIKGEVERTHGIMAAL